MEPASVQPAPEAPLRVFCSHAQADEPLLEELRKHLAPLRRAGLIEVWDDRLVTPGSDSKEQIDLRLDQADLILLLISPDFTASDYCYGVEAGRALARHARGEALVIPILLHPVDIDLLPIALLRPLPRDLRPVTLWPVRDEAWLDVERGIRRAVEMLRARRREGAARAPVSSQPVSRPFCVPSLSNRFYPIREDILRDLRARFTGDEGAPFPRVQCLAGFGGVGKTHTALHYASRYRDQYSAAFFVRAESELSLRQGFFDIARAVTAVTAVTADALDLDAAVRVVRAYLAGNPGWLLILDHVEDPEMVARFLPDGAEGHVLVTSQRGDVQALGVVSPIHIDGLSAADALSFFRARTGRALDDPAEREAAEKLAEELGRVPIALEQAAAYISTMNVPFAVHLRTLLRHPREVLTKYRAVFGDHRESVAGIWDISLSKVERESKASLDLLYASAFLEGERIPLTLFCRDDRLLPEVVAELGPTLAA
ncbi:MAG: TIR domain-containing protein, partial [Minicystis sp.]